MLKPIFSPEDRTAHFLAPLRGVNALPSAPSRGRALWDGEALEEREVRKHVPFLPRVQRLKAKFLCQPEQMLAIFRIVSVCFSSVAVEGLLRKKTRTAEPAQYRWRCNSMHFRVQIMG